MPSARRDRDRETVFPRGGFQTHEEMASFTCADRTSGAGGRVPELAEKLVKLVLQGVSRRFPHERNRTICRSGAVA